MSRRGYTDVPETRFLASPSTTAGSGSTETMHDRIASHTVQMPGEDGCLEWRGGIRYPKFWYGGRRYKASHMAYILSRGQDVPPGMLVRHRCDNPACVRPDHLLLGTYEDNNRDKICRERFGANIKLSARKARYIRQRRSLPAKVLARELGVCVSTVYYVWQGKRWASKCS